jgi:hypothetical protein
VKTLTKQSTGGSGKFFDQQPYDKVFDLIGKAKKQLMLSAAELKCDLQDCGLRGELVLTVQVK